MNRADQLKKRIADLRVELDKIELKDILTVLIKKSPSNF